DAGRSRSPRPADLPEDAIAGPGSDGSDQARWSRVKSRLRTEVGDDIFSSWFARMDLEGLDGDVVRFSVPTRFLKSWIQAHYIERVLSCWQAEQFSGRRIELIVRSAVLRTSLAKPRPEAATGPMRETREAKEPAGRPLPPPAAAQEAIGGSPLDPRLTFET